MIGALLLFAVITGIAAQTRIDHERARPWTRSPRSRTLGSVLWIAVALWSPMHLLWALLEWLAHIRIARTR